MQHSFQTEKKPNRLIHEKSPYLLQHAYNPVDWYPWGNEAFEKAKAEDKPLFASIGYSTCHWCHVMEKECFEDEEVAKLMNETFVCIKVDREERPDLDTTYMMVCQVMGRSCGWPLNVVMTPHKNVFFVASYIPKTDRFGMAGMLSLVPQINQLWKTRKVEAEAFGADLKNRIDTLKERTFEKGEEIGEAVLDDAYESLRRSFDDENGGFGGAPKFPTPHRLLFLLRYWKRRNKPDALAMVEKTLQAMRLGGIFDQAGFGFHRYSTDEEWLVPHFEKMLYDQALQTIVYLEAYQATGSEIFKTTAQETIAYVLRVLAAPEGGFYSAEDADSEGEEGKFYLWTQEEIEKALPPEDAELAINLFGIKADGNFFEPTGAGKPSGKNILYLPKPVEQTAQEMGLSTGELVVRLEKIQNILFNAREKRIHPGKDDKILVDWNGLMIAALARASQVFGEEKYLLAAVQASDFILEKMQDTNGVLYHRYAKGERAIEGFLDDYAFFVWGLLEVYEANFEEKYLQAATSIANRMVSSFWDEKGGFYFTAENAEAISRSKEAYDGAVPSGNSVALLDLLRLARLSGDSRYEEKASQLIRVFSGEVKRSPAAYTFLLLGVDFVVGSTYNVVLVGDLHEDDMASMLKALRSRYLPNMVTSLRSPSATVLGYEKVEGKATAYVCRNQTCMPPTNQVNKMLEFLETSST